MTTQLLIARHGNTFATGDMLTRVGARTDLPLVESKKGIAIGRYLLARSFIPSIVFSSPLKRTMETARLALRAADLDEGLIQVDERFREIDYGPDENQPEEVVVQRVGEVAIAEWNDKAIVPPGWDLDPGAIEATWIDFAESLATNYSGQQVLVVTSNGVARFSPIISGGSEALKASLGVEHLKIGTGHLCLFEKPVEGSPWRCIFWNKKP